MNGDGTPGPGAAVRWGAPFGLVWAQLLLSAWAWTADGAAGGARSSILGFVAAPAFSVVVFLVLRSWVDRSRGHGGPFGELVLLWLMGFLFAVHAIVVASTMGLIASMRLAVGLAVAALIAGLGPLLPRIEPGHPLGIRTEATLADEGRWRAVHRTAGVAFGVSGTAAFLLAILWPAALLPLLGCAAALPLLVALGAARRRPKEPPGRAAAETPGLGEPPAK